MSVICWNHYLLSEIHELLIINLWDVVDVEQIELNRNLLVSEISVSIDL